MRTQLLHFLVFRPPVLRPPILPLNHILKAGCLKLGFILFRAVGWSSEFRRSLDDEIGPFLDGAVFGKGVVVVEDGEADVFYL